MAQTKNYRYRVEWAGRDAPQGLWYYHRDIAEAAYHRFARHRAVRLVSYEGDKAEIIKEVIRDASL